MFRKIICLAGFISAFFAYSGQLKAIKVQANALILSIDAPTSSSAFQLHNPERYVIDLQNTRLVRTMPRMMRQGAYLIRLGEHGDGRVRVVLESPSSINARLQTPAPSREIRYQLSNNAEGLNLGTRSIKSDIRPRLSTSSTWSPKPRLITVVIDPGHGGKDPGAFGYHRTPEKQVVLSIAKRLKQKIDSYPGMRAILTRDGDYFIDLRRRLDISRRYHPDIFIAIHADAFTNPQSHGASVFALSQRGATSEAARWLAEKENYSELGGVNLRDLDDQNGMVRSVLIDLSQTATIQAGLKMGQNVLNYLGQITSLHNRRVEQARFVVLKSPDTPSILVETGFISNPLEEKRLASPQYQEKLSQAIFNGIRQYFQDYPPRGHRI